MIIIIIDGSVDVVVIVIQSRIVDTLRDNIGTPILSSKTTCGHFPSLSVNLIREPLYLSQWTVPSKE